MRSFFFVVGSRKNSATSTVDTDLPQNPVFQHFCDRLITYLYYRNNKSSSPPSNRMSNHAVFLYIFIFLSTYKILNYNHED